ncbi:hypothetical protein TW81_13520 [Vibrio galatheae]|uniref:Uncharacterized protein n=1 Tax=Vibrio galatheae TaxID=579748 RepID=A0A0F4NK43_9VIBR|nr:hypothetical protein [Vibrio galatheae]KJY82426.1 hypothetical protein TW81_13520 [Vibrio galatheae]
MAITIRDVDKHEDMLDELSRLTGETTKAKSLIKGGYAAIKYKDHYLSEKDHRERLQSELYCLKRKVEAYTTALNALTKIGA